MQTVLQVALLMVLAAAVNVPLGYQRQACEKFSFGWFFYVHISIPLIIYLRIKAGFGWEVVPFTLGGAVTGQIIGGKVYRKRNSVG
jgi:hypothetical protein